MVAAMTTTRWEEINNMPYAALIPLFSGSGNSSSSNLPTPPTPPQIMPQDKGGNIGSANQPEGAAATNLTNNTTNTTLAPGYSAGRTLLGN